MWKSIHRLLNRRSSEGTEGCRLFDVPWIIILVQFILILALVLGLFAFFLSRSETSSHAYSTRTYQNFELQTISPSSSPLTFRRRFKTTSESPQTVDFDFSEDVSPTEEPIVTSTTSTKSHHNNLLEAANSVETFFEHDESLRAAVFTVSPTCSEVGKSILVRGGNAVDAAIAASFCLMGALPNKASLAGGMMMTVKSQNSNASTVIARESAPLNTDVGELQRSPEKSRFGPKAAGTPGMLNGLFRAFQKYSSNRIQWRHLILPTIQQCTRGFEPMEEMLKVPNAPSRSLLFKTKNESEKLVCSSLAATLTEISEYENPLEAFYHGEMAQKLLREGGFLTISDLEDYESDLSSAICTEIDTDTKLCGPGPPSLFAVLANSYLATKNMSNLDKVNEMVRSSIGMAAKIGDPMFVKTSRKYAEEIAKTSKRSSAEMKETSVDFREDGSTEVFVIDENNMTVSVVLSLGDDFGNLVYSTSGFFWNNKMRYFDLKNENLPLALQPGKVPNSLSSPIIVVKNNSVVAVSGGSDPVALVHVLRDITHRNYDASKVAPSLFVQNSAISLKTSPSSSKYSITGY